MLRSAREPASHPPTQPLLVAGPGEMVLSCLVMGELLDAEVDRLETAGFAGVASGCSALLDGTRQFFEDTGRGALMESFDAIAVDGVATGAQCRAMAASLVGKTAAAVSTWKGTPRESAWVDCVQLCGITETATYTLSECCNLCLCASQLALASQVR